MKKNIDNPIVQRMLKAFGFTKLAELYRLIGKTSQNINGMINRETLIKNFEVELIKRNVNLDWIKTGQGEMHESQSSSIAETHSSYSNHPPIVKISDPFIQKTAAILESTTVYATALKSNIEAFHHAMTCEEQLAVANKRIDVLEENLKAIEKRLPAVVES